METQNASVQKRTIRRLSFVRLALSIILALGGVGWAKTSFADWQQSVQFDESGYAPWFGAYVDVTSTPTYPFERYGSTAQLNNAVLAFIVSSPSDPCTPTWGGQYTLDDAGVMLDLDRRIARFQEEGGRIAISFGGLLNSELGLKCTDPKALAVAYRSVIDRYRVSTVDLDLEGESLNDHAAAKRRADVIAQLQKTYREKGKPLAVWLTLPVAPQGLTKEGTDAVAQILASGVDLAGVNFMTMDYGDSRNPNDSMADASKKALIEGHRQLGILYSQAGIYLNSASLWRKIGVTPMVGQNDTADEVFMMNDAIEINQFSLAQGVGRVSMWSANRDIACGVNYANLKVVSDVCSGVDAAAFAFAHTLGKGLEGDLLQSAKIVTVQDPQSNKLIIDDPNTSPYSIWQPNDVYLEGTKVVWHGNVYQAKWWTKGDLPDNPVLQSSDTPWQLIGPVLPGDKPIKLLVLPQGTYPQWQSEAIYNQGDRVMFNGIAYQAKWWNQNQSPAAVALDPDNSPWMQLSQEQITVIRQARRL
ncbi:MAG: glycosyl hydrolase family 18 [Patescibacteria group bacterium]|nr:glycosyl hydrolase family 18 [Patescibacteria group bacterium]